MNVTQAQDELANRGFDYLDASRRLFYLNQAKNIFEDVYPFPWLEYWAGGTSTLVISDLKAVLFVVDSTTGRELIGLPAQQIVASGSINLSQTGTPTNWWLDGSDTVQSWPVSTATSLVVRYVKESPELVDPGNTPLIPARYHNTWIDLAVIRAYIDSDNYIAAQSLKQIVDADLSQIVQRYASRNMQNPGYQTMRAGSEDW